MFDIRTGVIAPVHILTGVYHTLSGHNYDWTYHHRKSWFEVHTPEKGGQKFNL